MARDRWRRALDLAPAFVVALPAIGWVWTTTVAASWASLGRDQGIFQYIAWAIANGEVAYRDVRDVNGPVVVMVHLFFQALGAADEHRFRLLDLVVSGATFAAAGASIPTIATTATRSPLPLRFAWALAAWVVLSSQYLAYGFWDTAQRESFLDWFVLVAIALQAGVCRRDTETPLRIALFVSGALSFVPWLGKPTYVLFTAAQAAAILVEDEAPRRGRRLAVFLAGGLAGLAAPLGFLALRGDLSAWARITFVDVPAMYRFIWPLPAWTILSFPGYRTTALLALLTSAGLGALVLLRRLPRRAIPVASMPALGLASMLLQAKGFPYHFHPVTLGTAFGWLVALHVLWRTARDAPAKAYTRAARSALVLAASLVLAVRAASAARNAPYPPAPPPDARDRASLESAERLAAFERIDYFPRALRDAAEHLAAHTQPDDRVQTYGMDAYVLFLARRRSASPYVYAYDLNADAALHGSFDPSGPRPSAIEAERIRAMRDAHARDLLRRLERSPPAAFVFVDRSPLMSSADAVADFAAHCPEAAAWASERYRQTADFEGIRVWLRDDLGRSR